VVIDQEIMLFNEPTSALDTPMLKSYGNMPKRRGRKPLSTKSIKKK
jgi:ABC-type polar amino acid transport system ATPase subunit